jgi:vacuolar-type H+-ATPase subunit H
VNSADDVAQNIPSTGEVKGKAEEVRQSANQGLGEAASKAREIKDDAAGKAEELKKDAANNVKDASNEANKKVQQQ